MPLALRLAFRISITYDETPGYFFTILWPCRTICYGQGKLEGKINDSESGRGRPCRSELFSGPVPIPEQLLMTGPLRSKASGEPKAGYRFIGYSTTTNFQIQPDEEYITTVFLRITRSLKIVITDGRPYLYN